MKPCRTHPRRKRPFIFIGVILFLVSVDSAKSSSCSDLGDICKASLDGVDQSTLFPILLQSRVCEWIKDVFWSESGGCATQQPCCCCDQTFVSDTNGLIKGSEINNYLEPKCNENPLQCDPNIDCNACLQGLPCKDEPLHLSNINLAKTSCKNTESGSKCSNFECVDGFQKDGRAMCTDGKWDLSRAKCLKPCLSDPSFVGIDHDRTTCEGTMHGDSCSYQCKDGYYPSDNLVTCGDGYWKKGPMCNKDDWCKHKTTPKSRERKHSIIHEKRQGWDRKQLKSTRGVRCPGARIQYKLTSKEYHTWLNFTRDKLDGNFSEWKDEYPMSPVDICEKKCSSVQSWANNSNVVARGFSINWDQQSRNSTSDVQLWWGRVPVKNWRPGVEECFCESADSKFCPAAFEDRISRRYIRYDFNLEKENSTAESRFKTDWSWDELRDPNGPFDLKNISIISLTHRTSSKCSQYNKCNVCEGDCNTDDDCEGHLRCWHRSDYVSSDHDSSFSMKRPVGMDRNTENEVVQNGICECVKHYVRNADGFCQKCPRGQIEINGVCKCDGTKIVRQLKQGSLSQISQPVHYFPEEEATYLIGYFNASILSKAGMEACQEIEDKDDFGFCCIPCIEGADCTPCNYTQEILSEEEVADGKIRPRCALSEQRHSLELTDLTPLPGFWRASTASEEFMDCASSFVGTRSDKAALLAKQHCCPLQRHGENLTVSICKMQELNTTNLADHQCQKNYSGPACKVCVDSYTYDSSKHKCLKCDGEPSLGKVFFGVFCILLIIFFLLTYVFFTADAHEGKRVKTNKCSCLGEKRKKKDGTLDSSKVHRETRAKQQFLTEQLDIGRVQGSKNNTVNTSGDLNRNEIEILMDRAKILYGWLQIFSSLTITFNIPWPENLKKMSLSLDFVNLDPSGFFPSVAGCQLSTNYTEKLIVHLCFPALLLITILLARVPAFILRRDKNMREKQYEIMIKLITDSALILYPGLCTRIFSGMRTTRIISLASEMHTGEVLVMDYDIEVGGSFHTGVVLPLVFTGITLYVIGVPLAVFMALKLNVKHLFRSDTGNSKKHEACVREFGNLYLQYEPRFWYWEIIVILKKMMLTGAMTVIASGSSLQIVLALLIVLFNLLILLKFEPFVDEADDWLSAMGSFQLMITLLGGLLITMDSSEEKNYNPNQMDLLLVLINLVGFSIFVLSIFLLHPKVRACLNNGCHAINGNAVNERNKSKVVPSNLNNESVQEVSVHNQGNGSELTALRSWGTS